MKRIKQIAIGSMLMPISVGAAEPATNQEKPNIVIFVADDLGANDITPYGNVIIRTPNLNRLAQDGLLFSNAFAASPTSAPSRAALHTGLYSFRNGAHANHTGIRERVKTLPSYLQSQGYKTALAGKLHLGPMSQYPFELIHKTNIPENGHDGKDVLWTDLKMQPVDEWLHKASQKKQPFLLMVNDHSPHVHWPEKAEYDPKTIDMPPFHIDTEETRMARARYYTDVSKMDNNLGLLLKSLEKYGIEDNTIVIFTSDQGPQWAFGKWGLYDYGIRVPLIIKYPGIVQGNKSTDALVSLTDILPTLFEIAGGENAQIPEIDGKSFLPLLKGKTNEHLTEVYASHTGDGTMNEAPMRMIRTKRYKYILNLAPEILYTTHIDKAKPPAGYWNSWLVQSFRSEHAASVLWRYHNRPKEELYDIIYDPNELNNIAEDPNYINMIKEFRAKMEKWRVQQGDAEEGPYIPIKNSNSTTPYIFD
ncbi:sulfatase [Parabacteroides sp. Marseille-P3160]|uniref:sulfatase family protein n=1 Tax=Parabacteroides sp. Marseille-P3160 TaxID=1917887 RepID=UPI0009BC2F4A|nr:sulfatase [Parabacteroides sp. Marseille-P3160]